MVGQSSLLSAETLANNAYPLALFFIMAGSLILTELLNFLTILATPLLSGIHWSTRIALAALTPIVPAMTIYLESRVAILKAEEYKAASAVTEATAKVLGASLGVPVAEVITEDSRSRQPKVAAADANRLFRLTSVGHTLHSFRATLRANENLVEHFVQVALLAIVLLAERSATRPVQSVGRIIIDADKSLVVLFLAGSVFSLVRYKYQNIYE